MNTDLRIPFATRNFASHLEMRQSKFSISLDIRDIARSYIDYLFSKARRVLSYVIR